ncbi:MAG: choice-of-anchor K domain-containing protein [Desulfobacteraceae bacterium]|nr:choice-of-anchor K domain-containing protein [Desulfobacteraceae bacterium]
MRFELKIKFASILFSLLWFGLSTATATTFSFNSYTGIIGFRYLVFDDTDPYYGTINGVEFTESDIDESLGTVTIDWGDDYVVEYFRGQRRFEPPCPEIIFGSSVLRFEASENSNYAVGEEFLLGTLTFTNGIWNSFVHGEGSAFSFTITASSESANLYDQVFSGTLMMFTNINSADSPEERADWFYIQEKPGLGSVRVFEFSDGDSTGTVELWGAFGSLDLVELKNPGGGAFLDSSITPDISPVPEPSTIMLFCFGILGFFGINRKKE